MANQDKDLEETDIEYEEYDEYEDEDEEEGGLSGLVVLLMGVVMLGAFASVVWIAYQQGLKNSRSETPYVAAEPEPLKIETAQTAGDLFDNDREVYDSLDGGDQDPVEIIAEGPEEPVERSADDPIGAIASVIEEGAQDGAEIIDDAVADRIASLEAADAALDALETQGEDAVDSVGALIEETADATAEVTVPAPPVIEVASEKEETTPEIVVSEPAVEPAPVSVPAPQAGSQTDPTLDPMSGSHLVQVGAFGSPEEAQDAWKKMQAKVGAYLRTKAPHVLSPTSADDKYYRLRVGPFENSSAASSYCQGLKDREVGCFIKAK